MRGSERERECVCVCASGNENIEAQMKSEAELTHKRTRTSSEDLKMNARIHGATCTRKESTSRSHLRLALRRSTCAGVAAVDVAVDCQVGVLKKGVGGSGEVKACTKHNNSKQNNTRAHRLSLHNLSTFRSNIFTSKMKLYYYPCERVLVTIIKTQTRDLLILMSYLPVVNCRLGRCFANR